MVGIFETIENGKSIIKGLSDEKVANIILQMNDPEKQTMVITEYDEDTDKKFMNIFVKKHIVKITFFKEE